jgi:hypothetical protein
MKKLMGLMVFGLVVGCQSPEVVSEFTGVETVYSLQQASVYPISGTVTFKERKDGRTTILVEVDGTSGNASHPVHLHLGDLSVPDAEIAALLTPLSAAIGTSETILQTLSDESVVTYSQLISMRASIKIHLGETGPERNIILAAGNIGVAISDAIPSGRYSIGICKSE